MDKWLNHDEFFNGCLVVLVYLFVESFSSEVPDEGEGALFEE